MTRTHYERLSTLDASFLSLEEQSTPMHVGSVSLFDARPFRLRDGELDFQAVQALISQVFERAPRLCQKVWWPAGGPPVWIDDASFDASYHFRRIALPKPGGRAELSELCGRLLSTKLDTSRPLWECAIVDGCSDERFAVIWKLHHCLADGVGVRDILIGYLGFAPSAERPKPQTLYPRPAPSLGQLFLDSATLRLERTRDLSTQLRSFLRGGSTARVTDTVVDAARGMLSATTNFLTAISPTPINGAISTHRRFGWTQVALPKITPIRKETGAKVNDVALAVVCGALRTYLLRRQVPVDDLGFRVMVPVNMRPADDTSGTGNHISNMMVPLPLYETDPRRRLSKTMEATKRAKDSGEIRAGNLLATAADWAGLHVPQPLARFAAERLPANLVVTNIPGPMFPQYLGESQLLDSFPVVPLSEGQGLGIALYGYNHTLYWGLNADRQLVPDVQELVDLIDVEVEVLQRAFQPAAAIERKLRAVDGKGGSKRTSSKRKAEPATARTASSAG